MRRQSTPRACLACLITTPMRVRRAAGRAERMIGACALRLCARRC